jgi:hypothetical protein
MAESTNIVRVSDVYKSFQLGKVEVKALQGVNLRGVIISPSWGHPVRGKAPYSI